MPGDRETLALSVSPPPSEAAWQRSCELAQYAMKDYLFRRAKGGHSALAEVFGGAIALGEFARALMAPEKCAETADVLCEYIRAIMAEEPSAQPPEGARDGR